MTFKSIAVSFLAAAAALFSISCRTAERSARERLNDEPPPAPREFRAVWVATVSNIDWPSEPGLSPSAQRSEAVAILDRCKRIGINAVVLQVRPACDALYESKLEPWSYYLTGRQGEAPTPYYDPLKFWIDESHARGIQLHAWFNPYRAGHPGVKDEPVAPTHISRTNPSIVREFNGWMWLDPSEPAAQDRTYEVFLDVARRYDVDGIHIDDYFYPYPDYLTKDKVESPFPDDGPWQKYQAGGGKLSREDWRRDSVNKLIERIYRGLKAGRPRVMFGVSPFGLGRPELRPAGIKGFSQFEKLYADADLWFQNGWVDYWTPQLYWEIKKDGQQFPVLVDYWISQNRHDRHLWPGLFTGEFAPARARPSSGRRRPTTRPATTQSATKPATTQSTTRAATTQSSTGPATTQAATKPNRVNPQEVIDQIQVLRDRGDRAAGHVHFSMRSLMTNQRISRLLQEAYKVPALVPASPWLDNDPPAQPTVQMRMRPEGMASIALTPGDDEEPWQWAIWYRYGEKWVFEVRPGKIRFIDVPQDKHGGRISRIVVTAVDRCGNESARVSAAR